MRKEPNEWEEFMVRRGYALRCGSASYDWTRVASLREDHAELFCDVEEGEGDGIFRIADGNREAAVAGFARGDVDGDLAEERDFEARGFALAAAVSKDVVSLAVARAEEMAHVFDEAEDGDVHFLTCVLCAGCIPAPCVPRLIADFAQ